MTINYYLILGFSIIVIGFTGLYVQRKNLLLILILLELIILATNFLLIIFSVIINDILGEVMAIFLLNVAAAESAVGLALVLVYFRHSSTIDINYISLLKG